MSSDNTVKPTIYMITGKGGVGKSTIALSKARELASKGQKTLLVELGKQSYFSHLLGQNIGYEPTSIGENLDASLWGGEACLREFIGYYIRIEKVVTLFFENKVMKTLVQSAPALQELAILGKLTSPHRNIGPKMDYQNIVVDGFSSGHFLSLIRVPGGMHEAIKFGPMGEQSKTINETLMDTNYTKYIVVTLPEEFPIQESTELLDKLEKEFSIIASLVANKIIKIPSELNSLEEKPGFINYLKSKDRLQKLCRSKLASKSSDYFEVPFVFSSSNDDISGEVAEVMRGR